MPFVPRETGDGFEVVCREMNRLRRFGKGDEERIPSGVDFLAVGKFG